MKFPSFEFTEIIDSKGKPTIQVMASFGDESFLAKVPSGTSTGKDEAFVIEPDEVIAKNEELNTLLLNKEFKSVAEFDRFLIEEDGTANKSKIGGNTILALSMLFCRLAAADIKIELHEYLKQQSNYKSATRKAKPQPMMVMIEGGVHAKQSTDIQELLVNCTLGEGEKIWNELDKLGNPLGMEGGFDITLHQTDDRDQAALAMLQTAIEQSQATATMSVDVAANNIEAEDRYSVSEMIEIIKKWNLYSVEDPFEEEDDESWQRLTREVVGLRLGTQIIGDDLTVTNPNKLKDAISKKLITGVIIKPNQVGSVSETLEFAKIAKENNLYTIVSHRSGETDDTFIADLAVAISADSLKSGANSKPERAIKYKRLAEII